MKNSFKFDHLGVAVADLAAALKVYEDLFDYKVISGPFDDPRQQAAVCFLGPDRNFVLELIAPLNDKSHVARLLAKGGGAYHVCYEVTDIQQAIADLRRKGCLIVSDPVPAVAYQGRRIAWFYTPTQQLMELVES